ncbi:MAG: 1-acyl-sn-glycerol-3-phosphate acyltransferase [Bacteroidales bacterium]|nr:1-acyl-sn-glycerol-3-phosphate acyltransferase [Bacteroidales bacterium]
MNLSGMILRMFGWSTEITAPDFQKCIICVAPHTSNWDFILGKLAYASVGRKAGFLMKESWFFFPLGLLFRAIGGVPVPRKKKGSGPSLVDTLVERFRHADHLAIAITPEGTRSRTSKWRTGFLQISLQAQVPILLGVIDYAQKRVLVREVFNPTPDIEADMRAIKDYYKPFVGRHPEKFTTD